MDPFIGALTSFGLPGVIIAGLGFWVVRLQNRVDAESAARLVDLVRHGQELRDLADARLGDAKEATARALELQESVHRSVDKLSELVDLVSGGLSPKRGSMHD